MVRVFAEEHFRNELGYKNLSFESVTSFWFVCVYSLFTATKSKQISDKIAVIKVVTEIMEIISMVKYVKKAIAMAR